MSQSAPDSERKKALSLAVSQIKKQFGDGAIMSFGKHSLEKEISVIKTGALALDIALGIGGVPRGRVVEIYGPESSGKSTLALHIVANAQRNGGLAAYIDAEHALDPGYAAKIGINLDDLMISQPDSGEEALNIAEMLARSNAVDVVVIDSVAALVPKSELEGEIGDQFMGNNMFGLNVDDDFGNVFNLAVSMDELMSFKDKRITDCPELCIKYNQRLKDCFASVNFHFSPDFDISTMPSHYTIYKSNSQ